MPATAIIAPDYDSLISGVMARMSGVADAAPKLTYYASQLPGKDTWFQTPEGYRIYRNVPIARTGSQNYRGREIKRNPGYKPEWGIADDELVTVFRPLEEVTAPAALASGEGKSTLDEHPPDPQVLVDALDEYDAVSMGHVTNVRVGEIMPDGETPVVADLWVKHPDLNIKIDGGIRDVSCGYTFLLDKDSAGRYIQKEIRLNHVAIVPTGRAGKMYGIGDAEPDIEPKGISIMPKSNRLLVALGLQAALKDAKPDEAVALLHAAGVNDAADEDEEKEKKAAKDKAAKDAEEKEAADKKAAKDKEEADEKAAKDAEKELDKDDDAAKDAEIKHASDCPCKECKGAKDKDEFGEDSMTDAKAGKDEDALILPADEHSRTTFAVGDAARYLDEIRPVIARCKDSRAVAAYKGLRKSIRAVQSGVKDGAPDPFAMLTRITHDDGANDGAMDEIPVAAFFNGKSYTQGLADFNAYQAEQAKNRRR